MILGIDLLTSMENNLTFLSHVIIGDGEPYKGCSALMLEINYYDFNSLTYKKIKPEESFINLYIDE